MMIGTTIATIVKRQFGDENAAQITDDHIVKWIDAACREITSQNDETLRKQATAATVANQADYALPTDLLKLHGVKYRGITLEYLSIQAADQYIFDRSAASYPVGVPTHYWIWDLLSLYPAPSAGGASDLTILYTRRPTAYTDLATAPDVPEQYHNRIVEYCIAQTAELDEDDGKYKDKIQEFRENVGQQKEEEIWKSTEFYPFITQ